MTYPRLYEVRCACGAYMLRDWQGRGEWSGDDYLCPECVQKLNQELAESMRSENGENQENRLVPGQVE